MVCLGLWPKGHKDDEYLYTIKGSFPPFDEPILGVNYISQLHSNHDTSHVISVT